MLSTDAVTDNIVTISGFQKATSDFIKLYCISTDQKGQLIEYLNLKSENCKKPMKIIVVNHQDPMEEKLLIILRFSTWLGTSRADLSEQE